MTKDMAQKLFNENVLLKEKLKKIKELIEWARLECSQEMFDEFKNRLRMHESYCNDKEKNQEYATACRDWYHLAHKVMWKYFDNLYLTIVKWKSKN